MHCCVLPYQHSNVVLYDQKWKCSYEMHVLFFKRKFRENMCMVQGHFIHSIGLCIMRQFLAILRSFFHSFLLCTFSCHPSPPTILPFSLTSSCHLFLGLPLNLVVPKFIYTVKCRCKERQYNEMLRIAKLFLGPVPFPYLMCIKTFHLNEFRTSSITN